MWVCGFLFFAFEMLCLSAVISHLLLPALTCCSLLLSAFICFSLPLLLFYFLPGKKNPAEAGNFQVRYN